MRGRRTAYLAVFAIAALAAALLVYLAQPRTEIVRAKSDIAVLASITADMVEVVRVAPGDAASGTARSLGDVVGKYAATATRSGQDVDLRAIEDNPGQRDFGFAAVLADGQVAFALPVDATQAVGGALIPGARVDVVAVPNDLKTNFAGASPGPGTVSMGRGLVVLALRTADGQPVLAAADGGSGVAALPPKLGAVVVAVPAARLSEFATAALTSTFYVALSPTVAPPAADPAAIRATPVPIVAASPAPSAAVSPAPSASVTPTVSPSP